MSDEEPRLHFPNHWGEAIGTEVLETGPEYIRARVMADERHQQPYGILHGGVYASIVEDVASRAAGELAQSRGQRGVVGVSNTTDFLRSHSKGELICEARPLHAGRRQMLWEVLITRGSDGVLVSRGQVRFQVLDQLPGER